MHQPRVPAALVASASLLASVMLLGACSGASTRPGFDENGTPDPSGTPEPVPTGDFDKKPVTPPASPPGEVNEVFGHSGDMLFRLDPKTNTVTAVGTFGGCKPVIDIALDEASTLYAVSYQALYTVDKLTAKCTDVATGSYPNSLSFVPKGAVDPNAEALVGYEDADYVRIDPTTGTKKVIGSLGAGFRSSGDIVSVKGGKSYLTVKSTSGKQCVDLDCLVEIDPSTGKLVKNWGSIEHKNVFGLSFWGGKVYGFAEGGELFEVTFGSSSITTTTIPMTNKPVGLKFWGAGSSTSAPLVATPQ